MSITNHLLAGTLIGLAVGNPVLAIPLAYVSHFAMDAIPHFGYPGADGFYNAVKQASKHMLAYFYSLISAITFLAAMIWLILTNNYYALMIGLVAVSPDAIMTLYYLLIERKGKNMDNLLTRINIKFHGRIQFERPWAIWIELVTFLILSYSIFLVVQ